ncbi:TPA: phosphoribosylformylglycinamidine synthase I [Candidatus Bathyarchaeota archaeon]|nr:phosphoribosylformylglycinamidine synthase I [Candidatus Bathyarchaeota archaeon]
MVRIAVIRFPGSNCDLDVVHVLRNVLKVETDLVWHKEFKALGYDGVVLPGGFSYGDYLRSGAIAARSPALEHVKAMADEGRPVLGICNGFQILVETGVLPGALLPNENLKFVCKWVYIRCDNGWTAFSWGIPEGKVLHIPIAHKEGRYFSEEAELERLSRKRMIVFRYTDQMGEAVPEANPNGSIRNIAGICSEKGNVLGLMPHPERASEALLSPRRDADGLLLFKSMVEYVKR